MFKKLLDGLPYLVSLGKIIKVPDKATAEKFLAEGKKQGYYVYSTQLSSYIKEDSESSDMIINPKFITLERCDILVIQDSFLSLTNKDIPANNFNHIQSLPATLTKYAQLLICGKIPQREKEGKLTIVYGNGLISGSPSVTNLSKVITKNKRMSSFY